MFRRRKLFGAVGATAAMVAMTMVGVSGQAGASPASAYASVAGSVAPFTAHTTAIADVSGSQRLSIQVWLRPDVAAASSFATAVSSPGSAIYHRYLSPSRYTAEFGPSQAEARAVESWLASAGFTNVHADSQRAYVRATAQVKTIDSAFKIEMKLYRSSKAANAGSYALRSNNRDVSVPRSLASSVLGVTGLDNAAPVSTLDRITRTVSGGTAGAASPPASSTACSQYYAQHETTGQPEQFGTTSFPTEVCGYSAHQLRAAYGANSVNTGKGETIALVELGLAPDMFETLQDYAKASHMAAPSTQRYSELSLGQGSACGDPFDIEEQLDVEASHDMAPSANQLVVGGDSCNDGDFGLEGLFNADQAILAGNGNSPLASIASNSWESGTEGQAPLDTNIEHAILVQAAAEGVGMYFSAGDGSGILEPSSDPFAIAVGGTTLGIGKTNNRLFETGWSTGESDVFNHAWSLLGEQGASGGGPSQLWKQPAYQHGVVPSSMSKVPGNRGGPVRSAPDISADADPFTGFAVGLLEMNAKGNTVFVLEDFGGTSEASPLVAGMVAAAQQGQATAFGFLNPVFYTFVNTDAVNDALPLTASSPAADLGVECNARTCGLRILTTFDDQNPALGGYTGQVTLPGYDNMTGVGTPNGQQFIDALRSSGGSS
jgi:subtilase family serine protease